MVDNYRHDPEGVSTFIASLKEKTNAYSDVITKLNNLINSINESSSWLDVEIKTSFINTCNSYIKIYNNLILAMGIYIDYIKKKSETGAAIESTYAGG